MAETRHFVNAGYGWTCKRCGDEGGAARVPDTGARARFFTEGEAEELDPKLSAPALARWRDPTTQSTLLCPRCGVEETLGDE